MVDVGHSKEAADSKIKGQLSPASFMHLTHLKKFKHRILANIYPVPTDVASIFRW